MQRKGIKGEGSSSALESATVEPRRVHSDSRKLTFCNIYKLHFNNIIPSSVSYRNVQTILLDDRRDLMPQKFKWS